MKRVLKITIYAFLLCICLCAVKSSSFATDCIYGGTMNSSDGHTLQYTVNLSDSSVMFDGSLQLGDHIFIASYDENGRLLSLSALSSGRTSASYVYGAKTVKIFWTDNNYIPKCLAERFLPEMPGSTEGYGIILDIGAGQNDEGSTVGYLKLMLPDGSSVFEVDLDVTGKIYGNIWTNTYVTGSLVHYELDEKGVIDVLEDAAIAAEASPKRFDSNGVYDQGKIRDDTIIYLFDGVDARKESSYTLLSAEDLYDTAFETMLYYQTNSSFDAILITDISSVPSYSGYAVVLNTGADRLSNAYVRLFMPDGTTRDFLVDPSVSGTISGATWENSYPSGTLVQYAFNAEETITNLNKGAVSATSIEFNETGTFADITLKESTVIFAFSGDDPKDAAHYEVFDRDDLIDVLCPKMDYFESSGEFQAILVEGAEKELPYAIFVSKEGQTKDGHIWTTLYEGRVSELTLDTAIADPTPFSAGSTVYLYNLIFDGYDVIGVIPKAMVPVNPNVTDGSISVSGSVFQDGVGTNYTLAVKETIYIFDESDDAWIVGSKSSLHGKSFKHIDLVDSNVDGMYDIVIAIKE